MTTRPDKMIRTSAEQALDFAMLKQQYGGRVLTDLDLMEIADHIEHQIIRSLRAGTRSPAAGIFPEELA